MRHEDAKMRELVSGFGEVWSSQVLCALLNQNAEGRRFCFLNARRVLIVEDPPEGEVRCAYTLCAGETVGDRIEGEGGCGGGRRGVFCVRCWLRAHCGYLAPPSIGEWTK